MYLFFSSFLLKRLQDPYICVQRISCWYQFPSERPHQDYKLMKAFLRFDYSDVVCHYPQSFDSVQEQYIISQNKFIFRKLHANEKPLANFNLICAKGSL